MKLSLLVLMLGGLAWLSLGLFEWCNSQPTSGLYSGLNPDLNPNLNPQTTLDTKREPAQEQQMGSGDTQSLIALHNQARSKNSPFEQQLTCQRSAKLDAMAPLKWNYALARAAQRQAEWMNRQQQLSHGAPLERRVKNVGYSYRAIAENIAHAETTPDELMRLWLASKDHCTNILNPEYRDIGVGYTQGYWVVILGREF